MKTSNRFHSIQFKIICIYMALMIFVCCCAFGFFTIRFNKVYQQQANSHIADVASLSSENISNKIEQLDQFSVSIVVDPIVQDNLKIINKSNQSHNEQTGQGSVSRNKNEISSQVRGSMFNINGITSVRIFSLTNKEMFIGTTNREYLKFSLTPKEIYERNGATLWELIKGTNYICLCRAILDTSTMLPLGYMVIVCQNDYFSSELSLDSGAFASNVYLVNKSDQVIASNKQKIIGEKYPLPRRHSKTGIDPYSKEDSYFYVNDTIGNDWHLISTVSEKQFHEGVKSNIRDIGILLTLALLLSLLITIMVIKKVLGPTQKVLKTMSDFGDGHFDSRVEVQGKDELGQIGLAYNQMAENIQRLMKKVYSLELANKEAEINALKTQITPHFLYNSLDTISWMGYMDGNEKISDIAVSLANLLRASLNRKDTIPVKEEVQIARNYLKIQEYRFEDKISVIYDIDEEAEACSMPSFLLQPLIENSIIHGLEEKIEKGVLLISIHKKGNWLYLTVADNGKGMSEESVNRLMKQYKEMEESDSLGLQNVYRRLQLLYGESCEFHLRSRLGVGTSISFKILISI
ncbi:cache domain-containing sensor histidine kinase [Lapidilactobacillus salsurivasis]